MKKTANLQGFVNQKYRLDFQNLSKSQKRLMPKAPDRARPFPREGEMLDYRQIVGWAHGPPFGASLSVRHGRTLRWCFNAKSRRGLFDFTKRPDIRGFPSAPRLIHPAFLPPRIPHRFDRPSIGPGCPWERNHWGQRFGFRKMTPAP